ncbi:hypothetical protein ENBRE01_1862 [Enteropsectra breve]|nr:hypothetical protein ENBRE01_1862 [Enteropsectra breve]
MNPNMNRRKASIILISTILPAAILGIILLKYNKQIKEIFLPKIISLTPEQEIIFNQYSAAVKFIAAPLKFQKELIGSEFDEAKTPFHCHLKRIITDLSWAETRKSKDLNDKLHGLSSLLNINVNKESVSIYDIIDTLAEKIDAERTEENHVFKCTFVTELVDKASNKLDLSETDKLSTVEGMLDDRGSMFPFGSLQNVFLKVPRLKSVEDKLNSGQNSAKYRFYKNSYTKMAVIFSINNDERSKLKGIITHYDKINRENKREKYRINAFLYLDKSCSQEGVYKTVTFADTNDFSENGFDIFYDNNTQILHFMYIIEQ